MLRFSFHNEDNIIFYFPSNIKTKERKRRTISTVYNVHYAGNQLHRLECKWDADNLTGYKNKCPTFTLHGTTEMCRGKMPLLP